MKKSWRERELIMEFDMRGKTARALRVALHKAEDPRITSWDFVSHCLFESLILSRRGIYKSLLARF